MERYGLQFLLVVLLGAAALVFSIFQPFLTALIMAAVFAVVLNPVYHYLRRFMPRYPSVAALLTVFMTFVVVLVPLAGIGTQIGLEATALYQSLTEGNAQARITSLVAQLESSLEARVPGARGMTDSLATNISQYSESGLRWFVQNMGGAFSGLASFLVSFFVFFVALYYLLRDGDTLKERLIELSPLKDSDDRSVVSRLEAAVNSVIKGTVSIAILQGFLAGIGFWIFGVPNSALWGTVAALSALIPGVGTAIVFVPAVLFLVILGSTGAAMGLTIWGVVAVGGVDNIVRPYLIGSGTRLHPLPILLSVLGGITFFGPVGIFLGPLSIALFFALLSIYADSRHYN
jgi:predicted PurR-regulated permease PerM